MTDTPSLSIFPLEEKDAPDLTALEAECFSTTWSCALYAQLLHQARCFAAGSIKDPPPFSAYGIRNSHKRLEAYICLGLHHAAGEVEIYNIAVRDGLRQAGLGSRLLRHALDEASAMGLNRALLEVRTGNQAARALYAKAGFRECGRRRRYYADTGEDALVLSRDLP